MADDFIRFERDYECETGKTQKWNVVNNRHDSRLGVIEWYGPWRQYVFVAPPRTHSVILNPECMTEISAKCQKLTKTKARV